VNIDAAILRPLTSRAVLLSFGSKRTRNTLTVG